ncbi:response regulator transcription factor [Falsochrobactrum sp. TDYN1]|uniref:Regulatory protein VirG n=1 Tax=Falsochrobactrum tianjinense TaxID=2706015 RepID=A0A949PT20_9HYPH|nr:response regulator transcription factor [Falsochrobactrum sp. TDYN1]MBV2144365.1 response regulator transcription factor [Falsochrobactrum sp. TDYN1]
MKEDAHVLIVDDDKDIRDLLHEFLKRRGLRVSVARNGDEMHELLGRTGRVDLIILDVMLPGKSGIEICQEVRRYSRVPIIMLTAIADAADKILGLEIGADDYIAKPFEPRELLARIRAVLRRYEASRGPSQPLTPIYRFAGWTFDCARRRLTSPENARVDLTTAEFNLLEAFVKSSQRILSRDQLMEMAGNEVVYGYDRSVDILISRLRRKLEDDPRAPKLILTIRGGGYQFAQEVEVA